MTPLERATRALVADLKRQADNLGFVVSDDGRYPVLDGCFDMDGAARAVIQAIREPSEWMLKAARKGLGDYENAPESESWRDMVDALLAEGE